MYKRAQNKNQGWMETRERNKYLRQNPMPCKCGCGQLHVKVDKNGRLRDYIKGHAKTGGRKSSKNGAISNKETGLIYGTLLGDSGIYYATSSSKSPRLQSTHSIKQKEWAHYKAHSLPSLNIKYRTIENKGYGNISVVSTGASHTDLVKIHDCVYKNKKKVITLDWLNNISEEGWAWWYMDDGSINFSSSLKANTASIQFHTEGFNNEGINILSKYLLDKGFKNKVLTYENHKKKKLYTLITMGNKASKNGLINIDSMLSQKWNTNFVDVVRLGKGPTEKVYDIEVEDNHNFVANNLLVHNCTRQSVSPFLDSLEFAAPEITVVLISMDLDKLDHIVREAIESRCIELSLDRISSELITNTLISEVEDLHPEAAEVIAYLCKGNMRKAWSLLEYFQAQLPIIELTAEFISGQKMGGLSKDKCLEIVDSLENNTWENTSKLLKIDDEEQAVDFFLTNIVNEDLNVNGIELISDCSFWLLSDYKTPIGALFRPYQGKKLVGAIIKEVETPPLKVVDLPTFSTTQRQVNIVKQHIADQLINITGKEIKTSTPECKALSFTKWSQFLKYYANNN